MVASEAEAVIKINNLVEGIEEEDSIAAWIAANSQKLGLEQIAIAITKTSTEMSKNSGL